MLGDNLVHDRGLEVLEGRPPEVLLAGREDLVLDLRAEPAGLVLLEGLKVIEAPYEQQVGDLLDHLERVGDPARPEGVPDTVEDRKSVV